MKVITYLLFFASNALYSAISVGEGVHDNEEQLLLESCQTHLVYPEREAEKFCHYYIRGFLAAVSVIDVTNTTELIDKDKKQWSPFFDRAYRTRVGNRGIQPPKTQLTYLCTPNDIGEMRVIRRLSIQPTTQIHTTKTLKERVRSAITAEYPCASTTEPRQAV